MHNVQFTTSLPPQFNKSKKKYTYKQAYILFKIIHFSLIFRKILHKTTTIHWLTRRQTSVFFFVKNNFKRKLGVTHWLYFLVNYHYRQFSEDHRRLEIKINSQEQNHKMQQQQFFNWRMKKERKNRKPNSILSTICETKVLKKIWNNSPSCS